jgi:hypothetical protein
MDPLFILPVFHAVKPVNSHLFLSALATRLPVLQVAFNDRLSFVCSLPIFESFLREMHSMIPQSALKDYMVSHISRASDQPFTLKTIVNETPHPYQNNMDYVRSYDFPSAIETTITFDSRTCTESNCDWLQIFVDQDGTRKLTDRLSDQFARWKEKIVTKSKHLTFKFHSDGSVVEWGYRATICAKIFSKTNFTSPHPADNVFRTFFNNLLKMMKICDASVEYIPFPEKFHFDRIDLTKIEPIGHAPFNEKFGTCFSEEFAGSLISVQLAMAHHLVDVSEAMDGCSEFVSAIVQGPFPVMMFSNKDLSEDFSNLANLMLFYIFQGIPDSQLDFLYKSLKGTKTAEQFVRDSIFYAENVFKASELTFWSICYAADKAALAF